MKLTLNTASLEATIMGIGKQAVRVGVLKKGLRSAKPARPLARMQLSPGVPRNKAETKGRGRNKLLAEVAAILNDSHGIFDDAIDKAGNKELIEIAQLFADLALDPRAHESTVRRLQNACRSIVRNPILRKEYRPNAVATAVAKGFNHFGVNTGTLFKNIEAKHERY